MTRNNQSNQALLYLKLHFWECKMPVKAFMQGVKLTDKSLETKVIENNIKVRFTQGSFHIDTENNSKSFSLMFIYRRVVSTDISRVAVSFDIFTYGNTVEIFLQTTSTTYPVTDSAEQSMFLSQIMAMSAMTNTE